MPSTAKIHRWVEISRELLPADEDQGQPRQEQRTERDERTDHRHQPEADRQRAPALPEVDIDGKAMTTTNWGGTARPW